MYNLELILNFRTQIYNIRTDVLNFGTQVLSSCLEIIANVYFFENQDLNLH